MVEEVPRSLSLLDTLAFLENRPKISPRKTSHSQAPQPNRLTPLTLGRPLQKTRHAPTLITPQTTNTTPTRFHKLRHPQPDNQPENPYPAILAATNRNCNPSDRLTVHRSQHQSIAPIPPVIDRVVLAALETQDSLQPP